LSRKIVRSATQRPWTTTLRCCCERAASALPRERRGVERRLVRARLEARLQRELLVGAVELPDAEPRRERDAGDRGDEDDDRAPAHSSRLRLGRCDGRAHEDLARRSGAQRRR
jgi:hypothetical protein